MSEPRRRGRPVTTGETPKRYFRAPDELWNAAMAKAKNEQTTLTAVLNEALRRYLRAYGYAPKPRPR